MPLSAALAEWPQGCPEELSGPVSIAARRVALGDTPANAFEAMSGELGADASMLAAIARIHTVAGCDVARLLEAAARSIERRGALVNAASIATSGTKLSGKIVAALPLMILPLVPAAGGSLFDRRGALLLVCGAALLLVGVCWIAHLLPGPPDRDEVGELAGLLASVLDAGAGLRIALGLSREATRGSLRTELESCAHRVRLGADWYAALAMSSDEGLRSLAVVLVRAERIGSSIARALDAFARSRADAAEAAFDRATRRAPVLMVLPLTTCILPGYALLAVGPLLRGLSLG
jgi:Flp pilus assembly protein TadB